MKNEPLELLNRIYPELTKWINSICRYSESENYILTDYKELEEDKVKINFYTKENKYLISARLPRKGSKRLRDNGYLGCIVITRKPRAGESWSRGSDLPDGPYSKETWDKIVNGILAYELVKVIKNK